MSLFHVFIYPTSTLYSLFILCFHLPRPFILPNTHSLPLPFWFCWDMLLCISIPLSFPLFKRNSHIYSLLFIVCSPIPPVPTAILRHRGYIVLYWRVRSAAVCSPTGSLSQRYKTRFQQIPLKPHNIFELSETLAVWIESENYSIKHP